MTITNNVVSVGSLTLSAVLLAGCSSGGGDGRRQALMQLPPP